MKHLLLTTIAAVVLVGCGPSVPDISIIGAADTGNIEAVKQHIAVGADVNAKNSRMGGTAPLHWAATKEIAELLISKGADVNAFSRIIWTPLDVAMRYKHPEITDLLLKHGGKKGKELKSTGDALKETFKESFLNIIK